MERLIEFSINHWQLVLIFGSLLAALFWTESRKSGQHISPQALVDFVNRSEGLVFDVRDVKDFRQGHITGAVNVPFKDVKDKLTDFLEHRDKPIILVCKLGQHSGAAGKLLSQAGFSKVMRLSGGINAWQGQNLPLVKSK